MLYFLGNPELRLITLFSQKIRNLFVHRDGLILESHKAEAEYIRKSSYLRVDGKEVEIEEGLLLFFISQMKKAYSLIGDQVAQDLKELWEQMS